MTFWKIFHFALLSTLNFAFTVTSLPDTIWLRSSIVSVLFSLIAKNSYRNSSIILFLATVDDSLGLLIVVSTVSQALHYSLPDATSFLIDISGLLVA
jgi:hypothetical protein